MPSLQLEQRMPQMVYELGNKAVTISGNAGFRMLSAPVSNGSYADLLSELWTQGMTGSDAAEASGDNVWTWTVGSGGAGSGLWKAR